METHDNNRTPETIDTLKVLIADDDLTTRTLVKAVISKWGFEVIEAVDGESAWQILQNENAPRLLILDWLMPRLDGTELCMRIRKNLPYSPYIILLTQVAGTSNIITGLDAGADEFLSKPFNIGELRSRMMVATRILRYENLFHTQSKQLEKYLTTINKLQPIITSTIQEIVFLSNHTVLEEKREMIALKNHLKKLHQLLEEFSRQQQG